MRLLVGAYAASPALSPWNPDEEAEWYGLLAGMPGFGGLELPYAETLHPDPAWLRRHLDPGWDLVVTAIPGTMVRLARDATFGLASPDPAGRTAALAFTERLREDVLRINDWMGRPAVRAVEVHSAPTGTADPAAFTDSLVALARRDWGGAALTVEHCDAHDPSLPPQKGFLPLDAEIAAVLAARTAGSTPVGITVNWARSAIEGRGAARAHEHIAVARQAEVLHGLMFSGCSDRPTAFGAPWVDAHLPAATGQGIATDGSLLTPEEIGRSLAAAGDAQAFTGVKIGVRPLDLPLSDRAALVVGTLTAVAQAASALSRA